MNDSHRMPLKNIKKLEEQYLLGTYDRYDLVVGRGSGAYLIDEHNRRFLDLIAGIGVNALGYSHPRIVRLLRKQIKRPLHVSNLLYHEYQGRLAKRLAELSGLDRVFFTNSGAESMEGCLKFARSFANASARNVQPNRIIAVDGAFHGRTFGALTVTQNPKHRDPFRPLPEGVSFVGFDDVDALEREFSDDVAAIVLEPIQGEGGVRPIGTRFYNRARELTSGSGALLIADEVQCGLGRTGKWFAVHKFTGPDLPRHLLPDLIAIAKPLGGGLPFGAVLMTEDVARTIERGTHGTTFGGGPLACRLSLELISTIIDEDILRNVIDVGGYFLERLKELTALPIVVEARGEGLMLALELTVPGRPIVLQMLENGFITNVTQGNVLRFLPPLIIRKKQIDRFVTTLAGVLQSNRA